MKEDIKDILRSLNEAVSYAEDCVASMQVAFFNNTSLPLENCKIETEVLKREEADLIELTTKDVEFDFELKPYISTIVHLIRMLENVEKLSKLIDKKIRENILFTEKAVNETIFLLQRLIEILKPTADIILARNTFLRMYILESQVSLEKMATEYATLHEDRLIRGECIPAAAPLYINMLDTIKTIAWNTKEIAIKLAG